MTKPEIENLEDKNWRTESRTSTNEVKVLYDYYTSLRKDFCEAAARDENLLEFATKMEYNSYIEVKNWEIRPLQVINWKKRKNFDPYIDAFSEVPYVPELPEDEIIWTPHKIESMTLKYLKELLARKITVMNHLKRTKLKIKFSA